MRPILRQLLLTLTILAALAAPAHALPGDVDTGFGGGDGIVTTPVGGLDSYAYSVVLQGDGKIVVIGSALEQHVLARYTAAGALDTTFGSGGVVTTTIDWYGFENGVALQADGKIVEAGGMANNFVLVRYTSSGSRDNTFGSGGLVSTTVTGSSYASSVALQADGKIVATGYTADGFALARYTSTGALDAAFGFGGIVNTPVGLPLLDSSSVALQADGKIVVLGTSANGVDTRFALARYTVAGQLDAAFGIGGIVITAVGASSWAEDVALQADGKIVAVGSATDTGVAGAQDRFALARYTSAGNLDATFGFGGIVTTAVDFYSAAYSVAVQSDGKILVAGECSDGTAQGQGRFVLARYTSNGNLDPAFGNGGIMTTAVGRISSWADGVALQNDGKVVVAGASLDDAYFHFALVRYLGDASTVLVAPATITVPLNDADGSYPVSWSPSAGGVTYVLEEATNETFTTGLKTAYTGTATRVELTGRNLEKVHYYRVKATRQGYADSAWTTAGNGCVITVLTPLNDNQAFVRQVYLDFLNREPDSAGLTYWAGELDAGRRTRAQIVEQSLLSAEFGEKVAPVTRLYFAYFNRLPDYSGLMYWVNQYSTGNRTLYNVSDAFAASPEFAATYGSLNNGQFVDLIYTNLFNRAADAGGRAYWVGELDAGLRTRGEVMSLFADSLEYRVIMANPIYVTMTYIGLLRRAPDQGGFDYWVGAMDGGSSGLGLIAGFLDSAEYAARFQ